VLFCAALFLMGIIVNVFVNEQRGRQAADEYKGELY